MPKKREIKKKQQVVSVVGLGKLGSCLAASLAYKGFKVFGYDANEDVALLLSGGKAPVVEPRLEELVTNAKGNLKAAKTHEAIIKNTDVTFIIVPTPSKEDGNFSDKFLKDVFTKLAPHLKNKKRHHLFIINSTVTPTTTDEVLIPLVEKKSGKKINKDFSVCYNPEFIALGDVINGILNPDVVLIGESNREAGDQLEKIYKKLCENKPYVARMSIVSAEIMKISLNSYITMKISFANTLGNICERIPGADVDVITRAIGADRRVSPHYLKAGLTFGGPCFPRDNRAFQAFANTVGIEAKLAAATDEIHNFQTDNLVAKIKQMIETHQHNSISILGLAYKPNTGVIEESASIYLIHKLLEHQPGIRISVHDRLAIDNTKKVFKDKLHYATSIEDCLNHSTFWIVTTPEKEYADMCKSHVRGNVTIIDCWRTLHPHNFGEDIYYLSPGGNLYE